MKILFLAHYFQPEPNMFFGLPFAKGLKEKGYNVEVLTGFPNYPQGIIYKEYRKCLYKKEVIDGITIYRVPIYPSHNRSAIKRIASYVSLAITQSLFILIHRFKADVVYVCQGPATIGFPSIFLKIFQRTPFVYHIQDLWPESLKATGMFHSKVGLSIVDFWCRIVYKFASHIVVISPGMKDYLIKRNVKENKISIIYNWTHDLHHTKQSVIPTLKALFEDTRMFRILYAGNIGKAQALEIVIDVAKRIQDIKNIQFILIGNGVEKNKIMSLAKDNNLQNVLFHESVPLDSISYALEHSNALFVHLKSDPLFEITIPSKIQAYLSMGIPILAAVGKDASDLILSAKAGFTCHPDDVEGLTQKTIDLYNLPQNKLLEMGHAGQNYYQSHLRFEIGLKHFINIFENAKRKNVHDNKTCSL